ncbi:Hypothetical protein NTJ_10228 [Nesidiocoris tenuis]|uniref:Uncharacterized protein n=1 Tax=Nesidiocoris tenuis TaxID=355587 RepID=A0ABN7B0V3_9HEMI|nr:Hypothetical protein NTJ_10228 [Nesidiocoris tenuis]
MLKTFRTFVFYVFSLEEQGRCFFAEVLKYEVHDAGDTARKTTGVSRNEFRKADSHFLRKSSPRQGKYS